jgi:hypothetical protein
VYFGRNLLPLLIRLLKGPGAGRPFITLGDPIFCVPKDQGLQSRCFGIEINLQQICRRQDYASKDLCYPVLPKVLSVLRS